MPYDDKWRRKISEGKKKAWAAGVYGCVEFGKPRIAGDRAVYKAFHQHRSNAALRSVEWELTLDEWWSVWRDSGKWSQRGPRKGQYCMSRYGDVGPYKIGNVYINLSSVNVGDGSRGIKRTAEQNARRSAWMLGNTNGVGRRWVSRGGRSTAVAERNLATYLADGWHLGRDTMRSKRRTQA